MHMLTEVLENSFIEMLVRSFNRSLLQINALHESDAEIVQLPDSILCLAITTDSISEEIESGLYTDPYLIGWMTVMVNASDLAAVGAKPIGLLLNETLKVDCSPLVINKIQAGINAACKKCNIQVLGGDTNFSNLMQMSAVAIGLVSKRDKISRLGCEPGDILFTSGPLGDGGAYALKQFLSEEIHQRTDITFQPQARLIEGQLLTQFASSCMDTSDGLFYTLDQLMRLNGVGFKITANWDYYMNCQTLNLCKSVKFPLWMMHAGPHGEFELVFTIPQKMQKKFLQKALTINWFPIKLGEVIDQMDLKVFNGCDSIDFDTGYIRNLFIELKGDISCYIQELFKIENNLKIRRKK